MTDLLQIAFSGLTVGAAYALVALGFGIVFRGTGAINFAQGEYVMMGGIAAAVIYDELGLPLALTVAATLVLGALAGIVTELVAVRFMRRPDAATITVATIGLALSVKAAVLLVTDRQPYSLPGFSGDGSLSIAGAALQEQTLWNLGILLVAAVALAAFFSRTRRGVLLRAAADDREMAASSGVSPRTATAWSFGLAGVLGAAAGAGLAPVNPVDYDVGTLLGLKGFAAAMLGGLGSMGGAVVGGLGLGLVEALFAGYVSAAYADVVAFTLLIVILLTRPTGLFAQIQVQRV